MTLLEKYQWFFIVFISGEVIAFVIFGLLKKMMIPGESSSLNRGSVFKGALERFTLFAGLVHGFPQMLIAFGALKLGTRLHEEGTESISNTYFLIGNLLSILLAITYAVITGYLWRQ